MDKLDWWEELCMAKTKFKPELPEDVWFLLTKKNPLLLELTERFSLELES